MSVLRMLAVSVVFTAGHFCANASDTPQYRLSDTKLPWAQYMMTTRPPATLDNGGSSSQNCVRVRESDVAQWIGPVTSTVVAAGADDDGGGDDNGGDGYMDLPDALKVYGTSLWLPAVPVATLVWKRGSGEQPFFQSKGCYRAFSENKTVKSYGPLSCFQNCVQPGTRIPSGSIMLLQGEKCFCLLSTEDFNRQAVRAGDQSSCSIQCLGEDHLCGGTEKHYSVYDLPSVEFPTGEPERGNCFTGRFTDNGGRLVITQQSCFSKSTAICVPVAYNLKVTAVADKNYEEGRRFCSNVPGAWLPSQIPHQNFNHFIHSLFAMFVADDKKYYQNLHRRNFWLGLELKTTHRWLGNDDRKEKEHLQSRRSRRAECSALTGITTHALMRTLPCDTPLPFLTYCSSSQGLMGPATEENIKEAIEVATAVGVTGIVCFVLFLSVAVTLFVLKKSGRLRIRQKPAFNSTGDWDDESVATRGNREAYLADLQARLSQTRGFELKTLPTANSKQATKSNTPSPVSRHTHARPLLTEYIDAKPLRNDYAEVDVDDDENHHAVTSNITVATRCHVAEQKAGTPLGLVDSDEGAGIYSELVLETEEYDPRDAAADTPSEHVYKNTAAVSHPQGMNCLRPAGLAPVVPTQPSQLTRPPRNDYEEPTITPTTASSVTRTHSDTNLPSHLTEHADEADSGAYSVPYAAHALDNGKIPTKMPLGEGKADPGYCVPEDLGRLKDDKLSAGDSALVEVGNPKENVSKERGSRVPHTMGPLGDMYAQPAKPGVVVVSLKKTASTTL